MGTRQSNPRGPGGASAWRDVFVTAAALLFCVVTVSLGNWQLGRGDQKLARQALLEARGRSDPIELGASREQVDALEWTPVRAAGEWLPARTVYLDNKVHQQRVGYRVLTPLRIAGSEAHVLVDRGWIAAGRSRSELPDVSTPAGAVRVEGIAMRPPERFFELKAAAPQGRVWQNLDFAAYQTWSKLDLQPVVVLQTSDSGDGLIRQWVPPGSGAERHRAYALQWYAFAAIAAGLYLFRVVRILRRHHG